MIDSTRSGSVIVDFRVDVNSEVKDNLLQLILDTLKNETRGGQFGQYAADVNSITAQGMCIKHQQHIVESSLH